MPDITIPLVTTGTATYEQTWWGGYHVYANDSLTDAAFIGNVDWDSDRCVWEAEAIRIGLDGFANSLPRTYGSRDAAALALLVYAGDVAVAAIADIGASR